MNSILKQISITDIEGFSIGQAENTEAGTGVTVILAHRMNTPVQALISGAAVRPAGKRPAQSGLPAMMLYMPLCSPAVLPSDWTAPQASCGIWKKRTSALKPAMGLCRLSVLPVCLILGLAEEISDRMPPWAIPHARMPRTSKKAIMVPVPAHL